MSWSTNGPQRRAARPVRLASGEPLASHDEPRTCVVPSCGTKLSRYNADTTCALHGGWADPPPPAALRGANRRQPATDSASGAAAVPPPPGEPASVDTPT